MKQLTASDRWIEHHWNCFRAQKYSLPETVIPHAEALSSDPQSPTSYRMTSPQSSNPIHQSDRYARQIRFSPLGEDGQQRLAQARALVCGCGALGTVIADTLVRGGVGLVRIVDRDFVELNNLQRQVLFDERDVADGLPKAIAAADKLRRINSQIDVEPIVADVTHKNIAQLAGDTHVIVDGTDNFETRFLINDFAVANNKPWVYGGCIGAEGQTMTILPGDTACLACLVPEVPPPGTTPTCDTAGIIGPIVHVIASIQAAEAIKILSGHPEAIRRTLLTVDVWDNRFREMNVATLRDAGECRACRRREFPWLTGQRGSTSAVLCGRNAVQLRPEANDAISLDRMAERLAGMGPVVRNPYLLRATIGDYVITLFADGRAIISGTDDPATARTVYAKYLGG